MKIKEWKAEHENQRHISAKMCMEIYDKYGEIREDLNGNESLKRFVSVYHTLGNYIPVFAKFNMARSGNFASYDYWDLTLIKIKEYYDNGRGSIENNAVFSILELLHCKDAVCNCIKWLSSYADWTDFI